MLEETGRIIEVNADGLWVETVRQSACTSCSVRKSCGQSLLASVGQGKRFVVKVDNPHALRVKADDQVVIGVSEGSFMKASLLLYALPLLLMGLLAIAADALALAEPLVILAAVMGLAAGFMLARALGGRLAQSCRYTPVLLKIV